MRRGLVARCWQSRGAKIELLLPALPCCRTYFTEHGLLPRLLLILDALLQQPPAPRSSLDGLPASPLSSPTASALAAAHKQQQLPPLSPASPSAAPQSPAAAAVAVASPSAVLTVSGTIRRSTTFRPHTPRGTLDAARAANLRQCALAVAALLQDDAQKDIVLLGTGSGASGGSGSGSGNGGASAGGGSAGGGPADGHGSGSRSSGSSTGGLDLILQLARQPEQALVQGAAHECLAVLTTYDPMRQRVKVRSGCGQGWTRLLVGGSSTAIFVMVHGCAGRGERPLLLRYLSHAPLWRSAPPDKAPAPAFAQERALLPMLLQAATSGPAPVQAPAAEAVANVAADPQLVAGTLGEQGLAGLVAMALSPDQEVQVRRRLGVLGALGLSG